MKKKNLFLTRFSTTVYVTSEFNFAKEKTNNFFLTRFSTIVYITSEFNFAKKKLIVILLILNKSKNVGYFTDFRQVSSQLTDTKMLSVCHYFYDHYYYCCYYY